MNYKKITNEKTHQELNKLICLWKLKVSELESYDIENVWPIIRTYEICIKDLEKIVEK